MIECFKRLWSASVDDAKSFLSGIRKQIRINITVGSLFVESYAIATECSQVGLANCPASTLLSFEVEIAAVGKVPKIVGHGVRSRI